MAPRPLLLVQQPTFPRTPPITVDHRPSAGPGAEGEHL